MKTSVPLFLLSFFFTIFWFDLHLCFGDDASQEYKACNANYNCGNLVNISYPFWGNERQQFCGRQEFGLNCEDNKTTMIHINSVKFNVLDINQSTHRMRIARSDLFDDYCPKSEIEAATLDFQLFNYASNDLNLSVWYDCPPLDGALDNFRFVCGSGGKRNRRTNYALEKNDATIWSRNMMECRSKIELTITRKLLDEGVKNRTWLVEMGVREGFDVEYEDLYILACDQCKASGGECGQKGTQLFHCICGSGDENPFVCRTPSGKKADIRKKVVIAIGTIIILIMSITIVCVYYTRKFLSNKDKIEESIRRYSTQMPKRYSYSKLKKITDSFKNKLGQGGYSTVYKGKLPDGRDVAVKLLNESRANGQDFMNEVVSVTRTSHVNIASLLGFCYERKNKALIYEYMHRGSLDKYISHKGSQRNNAELDWNILYRIVIGVARGLEYLHRGCSTKIFHFDIKPHNILLDSDFCPKISDFGLAKQCKAKQSYVSMTGVKGTAGFIAPEVIFRNFGKVSHKSDVYSYGMLVLDMVGARKNPNGNECEEYFPDWIYSNLTQSEIDGRRWWGTTEELEEIARKMVIVGLHCIQTLPNNRPSMTNVIAMLEGSVDGLQVPPKANLFGPSDIEETQPPSFSSSNGITNDSLIF